MPQKTCSTMTSLHHSPSTAKGMYPSKAGNWTSKQAASKNMQQECPDKLRPKVEETETRSGRSTAQLQHSGSTISCRIVPNPTAMMKLSQCPDSAG